jgi:hypothetical protein
MSLYSKDERKHNVPFNVVPTVHYNTVYQYNETNVMYFLFNLFSTSSALPRVAVAQSVPVSVPVPVPVSVPVPIPVSVSVPVRGPVRN